MKVKSIIIRINTKAKQKQYKQLLAEGFTEVGSLFNNPISGDRVAKLIKPII